MIADRQFSLVRQIFPAGVSVAEMDPRRADPGLLDDAEYLQVARAVEKRQREYAAGRILAHRLLAGRGIPDTVLLNGPDRAPAWPAGIVGTISHCAAWTAVAIGDADAFGGLGCDVELDTPLEPELWDRVLVAAEIDMIRSRPRAERGRLAKLIFSAKESCYKAQYYRHGWPIDFPDVEIVLLPGKQRFDARLRARRLEQGLELKLRGRFRIGQDLIATAVILEKTEQERA